jgi:hypothetical protein
MHHALVENLMTTEPSETANYISPDCFIRLEIKGNNKGSFEVIFNTVVKCSESLLTKENIGLACEVLMAVAASLEIKKFLKGEKAKTISPSTGENLIIKNHLNEQIEKNQKVVRIFFENKKIDDSISNIISCVKQEKRDSLSFVSECIESEIKITNEEYESMIKSVVDKNETLLPKLMNTVQLLEHCDLIVKKPDLIGDSKWELILDKHLEAKISDLEFKKKVKNGNIKLFGGCKLDCSLEINTQVSEDYKIISADYNVLKVHAIKDQNDQTELF